jgi:hypothetical protein
MSKIVMIAGKPTQAYWQRKRARRAEVELTERGEVPVGAVGEAEKPKKVKTKKFDRRWTILVIVVFIVAVVVVLRGR